MAFGEDADFNLVSKISDKTDGFAKKIYESGRSQEQLENFYIQVSDPKLKNVKFEYFYDGKLIQEGSTSTSNFGIVLRMYYPSTYLKLSSWLVIHSRY